MRRAVWGLLLLLGAAGCGHASLKLTWVDEAATHYDPKAYPDDGAVVLHRSDHLMMVHHTADNSYHQYGRHELVALQTEAGFDQAEVKIPFRGTDKIVELKARMKRPGQAWEELDPSLLLTDTDGTGEQDVNARFFRFPRIEVGALIEYGYVIESKGFYAADEQDTLGEYPTREYQFELIASKEMVVTTTAYNSSFPIRSEVLPGNQNRLSCEIRDIPHRPKEDFAPHWTFTEPRWSWRLMAFEYGNKAYPVWNTWNGMIKSTATEFYGAKGKLYDGLSAQLDVSGCADVACKVGKAREFLFEHAKNKNGSFKSPRPLKEVVETDSALGNERALLLRKLLADAGLDARLAYTTRHWSEQTDQNFPGQRRFNELLVYLPAQAGLPSGAWLSPRCDYCGLNELPTELRGVQALVFFATNNGPVESQVDSEWRSTGDSKPARPTRSRYLHAAKLSADGSLLDTLMQKEEGIAAEHEEIDARLQTADDRLKNERSSVAQRSALGKLLEVVPSTCKPLLGECELGKRFVIPAYATAESEKRWLVPLNALTLQYQAALAPEKSRRVTPLHFQHESELEEVFELEVPAGYVLESTPKPAAAKTSQVETTVKVEATPKGARVTRTLRQSIGGATLAQYDETRDAFRVFQDARHLVLSFVKK